MAGLLLTAMAGVVVLAAVAAWIAHRDGRIMLWRRPIVLLAGLYAVGAWSGSWPVDAVLAPAYAVADRLFVRG